MTPEHIRRYARRFYPTGYEDSAGRRAAFRDGCSFAAFGPVTHTAIYSTATIEHPTNRERRVAFIEGGCWVMSQRGLATPTPTAPRPQ